MKKTLSLCILAFVMVWALALPLSAFTGRLAASGFYGIGSAPGAAVTPGADGQTVTVIPADVNADGQPETFYARSDMLTYTYAGAVPGARYSVLLCSKHPAEGGQVFYADQVTAAAETLIFSVRPVLPQASTPLFLYLSCDAPGKNPGAHSPGLRRTRGIRNRCIYHRRRQCRRRVELAGRIAGSADRG